MNNIIGKTLIKHLRPPTGKSPKDVRDERLPGFMLRIQPSGVISYMVEYGRGKREVIGRVGLMEPDEAREVAKAKLRTYDNPYINSNSTNNAASFLNQKIPTFNEFIREHYEKWALIHMKRGQETIERLQRGFGGKFGHTKLIQIDQRAIDDWSVNRIKKNIKKSTVNRDLTDLIAALNKAVKWELMPYNPLKGLTKFKEDSLNVRYLLEDEEKALRSVLNSKSEYSYLRPLILTALNTGMRKGELLSLTWSNVNLNEKRLTILDRKNNKTLYMPINSEVTQVLEEWRNYSKGDYVFHNSGKRLISIKRAFKTALKQAGIKNFRFHDLRHTFASKLVMMGVDLNTVRELLGHADITTTLRYAHLAPAYKLAEVEKLVAK